MKICIIMGAFNPVPPLQGGAVEKMWFSLSSKFKKKGHKIYLISKKFGHLKFLEKNME